MNIESMTIGEAREVAAMFGREGTADHSHSFNIGTCYLVRTVTYHFIGKIVAVTATDLVIDDACWLADSGRFSEALSTGKVSEVETLGDGHIVCRGGIIDVAVWRHPTPGTQ